MATIPPEERQTNLVVALMATEIGLTKQQILENISGYRQRADAGTRADALEKMFERDKDELRALGVPIETIGDAADPQDFREARYRIPKAEYDLPADLRFSPTELAVLKLAGSVWSAESASADAQAGVRKIRALGIDGDEPIIGFSPRITTREPSFVPLQDAIERCRVVTFDYLKPGSDGPVRRRFEPLALIDYEARWHVYGVDADADDERTFLLSRIVGKVFLTNATFPAKLREGAGERGRAGLEELAERAPAHLEVTPGTEAALRLGRRARPATQGMHVPYVDENIFADELASYGPEVRVVGPAPLRDAVISRLRAVAKTNATAKEGDL